MVVLVILGLIAGAIGYSVFGQLKEAQIKTAKLDLPALSNGVDLSHRSEARPIYGRAGDPRPHRRRDRLQRLRSAQGSADQDRQARPAGALQRRRPLPQIGSASDLWACW